MAAQRNNLRFRERGKAPAIWAVVSSVLIQMMYNAGHGMTFLTAISCTLIKLVCFAFVDDTDTIQTGRSVNSTGEEVIPLMQDGVDRWEGGLWMSGGAIVPDKSFWILIDFKWTPNGWRYRTKEDMPGHLYMKDAQRRRIQLRCLEPSVGTTTLGVHMAMDGSTSDVVSDLRAKAAKFGDAIRTAHLSHNDAWFTLNSSFMKTMEYPVVACNLKKGDWEHILVPALRAGTGASLLPSDDSTHGSYKVGHGSAAWVMASPLSPQEQRLSGVTWVLGGDLDQNSFRSELVGILGILVCTHAIMEAYDIQSGNLDGQSAIDAIQQRGVIRSAQQSADVLQAIQYHCQRLEISWRWIEGHQLEKRSCRLEDLDWWGRANTAVDLIAMEHLNQGLASNRARTNQVLAGEGFAFFHEGVKLARIDFDSLYSDLTLDDICQYWAAKHDISWDDIDNIDWDASGLATKGLPLGIQRWQAKFATGHCGVGRMEQHRGHQAHARCPRCHHRMETTQHVLKCPATRANTQWRVSLTKLRTGLQKLHTAPWIEAALLHCIDSWRKNRVPELSPDATLAARCVVAQHRIGWWNMCLGRLSSEWQDAQRRFWALLQSKLSPRRWTAGVIRLLLLTAWDMWSDRNDALHGSSGELARIRTQETHREIRSVYHQGHVGLPPEEHHWFSIPLCDLLRKDTPFLQAWLENVTMARQAARQRRQLERATTPPMDPPMPTLLHRWLASAPDANSGQPLALS